MTKENIFYLLKSLKIDFIQEHKFLYNRKFRFDFAIVEHKIAIEYEGIMAYKSRHTSVTGYSKDCEKYNLAVINGWRVLRYTALNISNLENDLNMMNVIK